MTKNIKTLIVTFVLVALAIGGYFGAKAYQRAKTANAAKTAQTDYSRPETISLFTAEREELASINFATEGFTLVKAGEEWAAEPPFPGPLDQDQIGYSLLWSLTDISAMRIIEESPADLSVYGLDNPRDRVIITKTNGEASEFFGGNNTPTRDGRYVMMKGDPKVYIVSSYSSSALFSKSGAFRIKTLLSAFEMQNLEKFIFDFENIHIDIAKKAGDDPAVPFFASHVLKTPYTRPYAASSDKLGSILEALQNLQVEEYIDPKPVSAAPYGLDKPARLFIEISTGESIDLQLGKVEGGSRFARKTGTDEVFTIADPAVLSTITAFSLVDKFALIINIVDVNSFAVRGGPQNINGEIRRTGAGEEVEETYFVGGKQAEEKSFKAFYQALIGLMADAEHPDRPQRSSGAAEITIEYSLNKPAGGKTSIALIPFNRDFYALDREGVIEFLVSRAQVRSIFDTLEKINYID
ncbi:hypothetical protein AGMMS49928_20450 [Spirochaetia bacterium]|nr:hypothetical protein AGMMS49928_20450 [Spirochaetia bacterium]